MNVIALIVSKQTNGAVPIKCELNLKGNYLQIGCNGDNGFVIEVQVEDIETILADDLHG